MLALAFLACSPRANKHRIPTPLFANHRMLEQRRADFEREKASAERERGEREAAKALPRTLSSLGGKKKGKLF